VTLREAEAPFAEAPEVFIVDGSNALGANARINVMYQPATAGTGAA
jgi:hypothetical protein